MPVVDEVMSQTGTPSYSVPISRHKDYDCAMSDASSALSDPPPEMHVDGGLESGMDLDLALDLYQRTSPSPSSYEESPEISPWRRPALNVPDVNEVSSSGSESDCDNGSEDESAYNDVPSCGYYVYAPQADESLTNAPFEESYKLKIDSIISKFEKLPYEVGPLMGLRLGALTLLGTVENCSSPAFRFGSCVSHPDLPHLRPTTTARELECVEDAIPAEI